MHKAAQSAQALRNELEGIIFGQSELIMQALCAFLAGGHILITGAPGLAKTTLVRVFAQKLKLRFGRIQFTPDLLPSDITGSEILNINPENQKRSFEFSPGPIFANLLLADEVNRASPRTQSAMLEAMQERKITVGGKEYRLPQPFMVFATQNPFESEGTFPLPEAQLDRFLLHSLVEYPTIDAEEKILSEHAHNTLVGEQTPQEWDKTHQGEIWDDAKVSALIHEAQSIPVDQALISGINELVRSTRPTDPHCPENYRSSIWYGAGPRAGISLISVCRSLALIEDQTKVSWEHVRRMAKPVLRHRVRLSHGVLQADFNADVFIDLLLREVEARNANLAHGIQRST